jgi:hypothetical protein
MNGEGRAWNLCSPSRRVGKIFYFLIGPPHTYAASTACKIRVDHLKRPRGSHSPQGLFRGLKQQISISLTCPGNAREDMLLECGE